MFGFSDTMALLTTDIVAATIEELCSDEKMVDASRFLHGYSKSFQSQSIVWAHPDHFYRDPVLMNPCNDRQPDVEKGLFAFQP